LKSKRTFFTSTQSNGKKSVQIRFEFIFSDSREVQTDAKKLHGRKLRHKSIEKISPKNQVSDENLGSVVMSLEPGVEKFAFSQLMQQMAEKYQDKKDVER